MPFRQQYLVYEHTTQCKHKIHAGLRLQGCISALLRAIQLLCKYKDRLPASLSLTSKADCQYQCSPVLQKEIHCSKPALPSLHLHF